MSADPQKRRGWRILKWLAIVYFGGAIVYGFMLYHDFGHLYLSLVAGLSWPFMLVMGVWLYLVW